MVVCSAFGCKSRSDKKELGISFHRFPLKDLEKLNIWVKNMKVGDWKPTKTHRLCSKHFKESMFYSSGGKKCLLYGAVPDIFLELPKSMQSPQTKKRGMKRSADALSTLSETPKASTSGYIPPDEEDSPRKIKLRKRLFQEVVRSRRKTKKIRVLGQKLKRYKQKIISLKKLTKDLKSKYLLSEEQAV